MRITVTIARQFGCGGSVLGQRLADDLGIRCLDREIVSRAARHLTVDEEELTAREEKGSSFWERMLKGVMVSPPEAMYHTPPTLSVSDRDVFQAETEVMKEIAGQEDCVIVGRAASHVLPDHPGTVHIYLHAPMRFRVRRVMEQGQIADEAQARAMIVRSDEARKRFLTQMLGQDWDCAKNYHLSLDTSALPLDQISELLLDFVRRKTGPRPAPPTHAP